MVGDQRTGEQYWPERDRSVDVYTEQFHASGTWNGRFVHQQFQFAAGGEKGYIWHNPNENWEYKF